MDILGYIISLVSGFLIGLKILPFADKNKY